MKSTFLISLFLAAKVSLVASLPSSINASAFATVAELRRDVDSICSGGLRIPGGKLHGTKIAWLRSELKKIPGLVLSEASYGLLAWEPLEGHTMQDAASLSVAGETVEVAGAVAYSKPTGGQGVTGPLTYIPLDQNLTVANSKGKILVRNIDYPNVYPYSVLEALSYKSSHDFNDSATYRRPSVAPTLLGDMVLAAQLGALGVITVYDVPSKFVASQFYPHDGEHYRIPGLYLGVDEGQAVIAAAKAGKTATMSVQANVYNSTTTNLYATLPGQSPEKIVYVSHTDGVTFVQENGAATLMNLLRYFAAQPLSQRSRTIDFAFNTGHLHLSREGTNFLSLLADATLETNNYTLVIPVEHMGTREIDAFPRGNGLPGNTLRYTGEGEAMIWCVGPMPPVIAAAEAAFTRRKLDKTVLLPGASFPQNVVVPQYTSFAGIGTYFHTRLVPTTSLISGPWSLWAPYWGAKAVDYRRLRRQALALGDLYYGVQNATKAEILGTYATYREQRANGTKAQYRLFIPPEQAPL